VSYQIYYQKTIGKPVRRLPFLIILCFQLFLVLVYRLWPEGADVIRNVLHRTENSAPVFALDFIARELRSGETVIQAFSDLLHDIR
jgi:multisubunit Na+/H+ antiporter MnhE subunit